MVTNNECRAFATFQDGDTRVERTQEDERIYLVERKKLHQSEEMS